MRQDIIKQMYAGDTLKAMKNIATLVPLFTAGNMAIDELQNWIFDRESKTFEESLMANLWRNTGFFSKYDYDNLAKEGIVDTVWAGLQPPLSPFIEGGTEVINAGINIAKGEYWSEGMNDPGKDFLQNIPIVGRLLVNWLYN